MGKENNPSFPFPFHVKYTHPSLVHLKPVFLISLLYFVFEMAFDVCLGCSLEVKDDMVFNISLLYVWSSDAPRYYRCDVFLIIPTLTSSSLVEIAV